MSRALLAAVSGLRANQMWIDVIGANLANSNTGGFKASRALFANLLSQTFSPGSAPSSSLGGTNPNQIGLGAQVARIDRVHTQGTLAFTGRPLDMAISGAGYFMVNNGSQDLYTLPLGLRQLQQLDPSDWPLLMSGAVMLTVLAVLFFLLVQHLFLGERGLGSRRP